MNLNKLKFGSRVSSKDNFVIMAGPCAIESYEICKTVAIELKRLCEKYNFTYIFKSSYDKANRLSVDSYRGPGLEKGLEVLSQLKGELNIPIVSDISQISEIAPAAEVLDVLQIPAYLVHYTELVEEIAKTDKILHVKKPQDFAVEQMKEVVDIIKKIGNNRFYLTERGTSFGYNQLINDMKNLSKLREYGAVLFDATHSSMEPGGMGTSSGGTRKYMLDMIRAAVAIGINGLYLEVHPNPSEAMTDKNTQIPLHKMDSVLQQISILKNAAESLNIFEELD